MFSFVALLTLEFFFTEALLAIFGGVHVCGGIFSCTRYDCGGTPTAGEQREFIFILKKLTLFQTIQSSDRSDRCCTTTTQIIFSTDQHHLEMFLRVWYVVPGTCFRRISDLCSVWSSIYHPCARVRQRIVFWSVRYAYSIRMSQVMLSRVPGFASALYIDLVRSVICPRFPRGDR